jgi:hypothetical protein
VKVTQERESSSDAASRTGRVRTEILAPQMHRVTHLFLLRLSFSLCSDGTSKPFMLVHALDTIQLRIFYIKSFKPTKRS